MADIGAHSIVVAVGTGPEPLEQFNVDVIPDEAGRVGPAPGPVDPGEGPVGVGGGEFDPDEGGEVVLVHVAGGRAEFVEDGEEFVVGDDLGGEGAVDLEPLGALAPLVEVDSGPHARPEAAAAHWAG